MSRLLFRLVLIIYIILDPKNKKQTIKRSLIVRDESIVYFIYYFLTQLFSYQDFDFAVIELKENLNLYLLSHSHLNLKCS